MACIERGLGGGCGFIRAGRSFRAATPPISRLNGRQNLRQRSTLIHREWSVVSGSQHHKWRGDNVGYRALHSWVLRHKGVAEFCCKCGASKDVQWSNKSGDYRRDLNDFWALCRPCHKKYDLTPAMRGASVKKYGPMP